MSWWLWPLASQMVLLVAAEPAAAWQVARQGDGLPTLGAPAPPAAGRTLVWYQTGRLLLLWRRLRAPCLRMQVSLQRCCSQWTHLY
jgi:hypothetical protein